MTQTIGTAVWSPAMPTIGAARAAAANWAPPMRADPVPVRGATRDRAIAWQLLVIIAWDACTRTNPAIIGASGRPRTSTPSARRIPPRNCPLTPTRIRVSGWMCDTNRRLTRMAVTMTAEVLAKTIV